jgi:hypothetical protein
MKLLNTTLNYIVKTNEQVGIWTEKIICDVLNISFNSKREYIVEKNYPRKLKDDIFLFQKNLVSLNISEHLGNKNQYYDFKTINNKTVSLKTNISGNKICPQILGQVSLQKFKEKYQGIENLQTTTDYKTLVLNDTRNIVNLYLSYLFCCDHLICFKYDIGKIFHFSKSENVTFDNLENIVFKSSKELSSWNNSMSLTILIKNISYQLCEFQVHSTRNCLQCRFNLDTVVLLVNNNIIKNVSLESFDLIHKYNIKVFKKKFQQMDNQDS